MKVVLLFLFLGFCLPAMAQQNNTSRIIVLGVAQDGGYPHVGCMKKCCNMAWEHPEMRRNVVSLAVVQAGGKDWWLFEATPDIKEQLQYFRTLTGGKYNYLPKGIFITHAHIGHYTGLMQFGKEVMGTKDLPVYVLPKMKQFLETNGPWSQLVTMGNIRLVELTPVGINNLPRVQMGIKLADGVGVSAFTVPHRDEFSETAGFRIAINNKRYIFIPDIDKWAKWGTDIRDFVADNDIALVDGTFYGDGEIPGRNMSEIPHPFVSETMALFNGMADSIKSKVYFIHFNHTNPLLWDADKRKAVRKSGFNIAEQGQEL
jgi:pyrroloquinoline quinone biosynthesis protein B